ncbi:hypothetical protein G7B40_012330 [Aetokthonos hydrillicola Thurmond2011]|uniref:Uncharacterized protein n=2 Tax=Aetokthonos TaxID=1550243 RepID=A0AAP5I8V9_9CYAN|nr:Npun_F0494 family protein [Aetokthonos hydrillicola]MBW4584801.1 hypothetical protein [Aetokthonos hydrillicola CCALA 1050]MDR9895348.1 hypothetical protein [Aetokthonos hydrillicola Thurmond2011]
MSNADLRSKQTITYSHSTLERAERSLICSPFKLSLLEAMQNRHVPLGEIAGNSGVQHGYTQRPLSELATDNALVWLIQVGALRREVDGQGITDSFRLTPLGRQLVEQFQQKPWRTPSWRDRIIDFVIRWLRLPF